MVALYRRFFVYPGGAGVEEGAGVLFLGYMNTQLSVACYIYFSDVPLHKREWLRN